MIPYGRQSLDAADKAAVMAVLDSPWLTQGDQVPAFEKALCDLTGAQYAIAVTSGTAALHLAYLALGVGKGDWVWSSPISFVATTNAALLTGAQVDFVDIDPATGLMDLAALEAKLMQAQKRGRLPKVVTPVHYGGQVMAMPPLAQLADKYGFQILEDAAHALGGAWEKSPVGSGHYAQATVLSFHPVKPITTGEGGAILTNDATLAHKARLLRNHGISKNPAEYTRPGDGPWYYEQQALGFNYRMTDIQAALGRSQLKKLPTFIQKRAAIAARYQAELPKQVQPLAQDPQQTSAWHLFVVKVPHRAQFFQKLKQKGIGTQVHYIPIPSQPYYQNLGFSMTDFPQAQAFYEQILSLPLYPALSDQAQTQVIEAVHQVLAEVGDA